MKADRVRYSLRLSYNKYERTLVAINVSIEIELSIK